MLKPLPTLPQKLLFQSVEEAFTGIPMKAMRTTKKIKTKSRFKNLGLGHFMKRNLLLISSI